jgi:DNA-binding SARP family transcriptional activator
LRATLFETLRLYTPDGQPIEPGSPTTRSLTAYLLLNRSRPIDRRRLAFTFWSEASESAARRNLRQYLHQIRSIFTPIDPEGRLLRTDASSVQINPEAIISLDIDTFLEETRPDASLDEMNHALSLYTGDLLEDIYDDWCAPERNRLRQVWLHTLERYCQALQNTGQLADALAIAQSWITAEPFDENARRSLMQSYALTGDRTRAKNAYQAFTELLQEELGTEPLPETQALMQSIQNGDFFSNQETISPPISRQQSFVRSHPHFKPTIPFVGRKQEISTLEQAYQEAKSGSGRLVLITGEAGIGKTRLLQEYMFLHPESSSLHSACYELESMVPYAPLRQALGTSHLLKDITNGTSKQLSYPWTLQLAPLFPELSKYIPFTKASGFQNNGDTLREALVNLLVHLSETSQNGPLHLILDDLHWADTPTWELLASLARSVRETRLLIIGIFRFEDLAAERQPLLRTVQRNDHLWTLDLPRLTSSETSDLAHHITPEKAKNSIFVQRLYQETEGNPFFIIETVNALKETQSLHLPLPVTAIPNPIQQVIEARLDRLVPESREALAGAACIGRSFTYPLLQEILGTSSEEVITYIEEWLQRGLIHEDKHGYDFRHDKFRQVAYASLSRARREYVHRRIAYVLEHAIPKADVTTLAHHFARSDQPLKALPFLTQAGEQALSLRSYHEVRQFGLQAVNLLGQLPGPRQRSERIDINLQLAQAYAFTGDMKRAIEILYETEQLAIVSKDEKRLGHIFRRSAQFFWLRGQTSTASDYAHRTLRVAEEQSNYQLLYAALRMLGRVSIALAAFDDAIAYLVRYTNLYEKQAETNPQARLPEDLPIIFGYLGVAYSRVGAWDQAFQSAKRGLDLAERASGGGIDARTIFARMQLAMVHAGAHKWDECLNILAPIPTPTYFEEFTPPLYMVLSLQGYAQAKIGRTAEGIRSIQNAVDWAERVGHRVFHYLPRLFLAESLFLGENINQAKVETEHALSEARRCGNRWAIGTGLKLQADIHARTPFPTWTLVESDLIESMHLLRQIRARTDLARTYISLRRLYDRAGQIAWAVDCHFRAITIYDELGMEEELRHAQGQAAGERQGAIVIPNLPLRGPNVPAEEYKGEEVNSLGQEKNNKAA